jgi:hypothetical protein
MKQAVCIHFHTFSGYLILQNAAVTIRTTFFNNLKMLSYLFRMFLSVNVYYFEDESSLMIIYSPYDEGSTHL